jgi:hypothetical protein
MSTVTLAQLGRKVNAQFTPDITDAFLKAAERNPSLNLTDLVPEERQALAYWFSRYYGIQVTQVANLRATINQPVKHLALDLVALMKSEVEERAGLSAWFPKAE